MNIFVKISGDLVGLGVTWPPPETINTLRNKKICIESRKQIIRIFFADPHPDSRVSRGGGKGKNENNFFSRFS